MDSTVGLMEKLRAEPVAHEDSVELRPGVFRPDWTAGYDGRRERSTSRARRVAYDRARWALPGHHIANKPRRLV
jgi:hypothetical protein